MQLTTRATCKLLKDQLGLRLCNFKILEDTGHRLVLAEPYPTPSYILTVCLGKEGPMAIFFFLCAKPILRPSLYWCEEEAHWCGLDKRYLL